MIEWFNYYGLIREDSSCREISEAQNDEKYKLRFFDDLIVLSPINLKHIETSIRNLTGDINGNRN